MTDSIQAEHRDPGTTSGELRQMREEGKVPGVVYGKTVKTSPIMVDEKELMALLKGNSNGVVQIELEDQGQVPVMVEEVQQDTLKRNILHVDFREVNMREPVRAHVRVELTGTPIGLGANALLQVQKNEVEVHCLPDRLPSVIQADISHLDVGKGITAKDLVIPDGVELMTEPEEVIATLLAVKKPVDAEEAEAIGHAAEGEAEKTQVAADR